MSMVLKTFMYVLKRKHGLLLTLIFYQIAQLSTKTIKVKFKLLALQLKSTFGRIICLALKRDTLIRKSTIAAVGHFLRLPNHCQRMRMTLKIKTHPELNELIFVHIGNDAPGVKGIVAISTTIEPAVFFIQIFLANFTMGKIGIALSREIGQFDCMTIISLPNEG